MKTIGSAIIMLVLTPSLFADNGKELEADIS